MEADVELLNGRGLNELQRELDTARETRVRRRRKEHAGRTVTHAYRNMT